MKHTLVLNNNYIPIGIIDSKQAFKSVYCDKTILESSYNSMFHSSSGQWPIPSIIRTKYHVKLPFTRSTLSKENIYKRDSYTCVYCGDTDKNTLTIDHIIPKSRGGKNRWDNLVTSCYSCNNIKGNRDPDEMSWPWPKASQPHYLVLMNSFVKNIPNDWKTFLFL